MVTTALRQSGTPLRAVRPPDGEPTPIQFPLLNQARDTSVKMRLQLNIVQDEGESLCDRY